MGNSEEDEKWETVDAEAQQEMIARSYQQEREAAQTMLRTTESLESIALSLRTMNTTNTRIMSALERIAERLK